MRCGCIAIAAIANTNEKIIHHQICGGSILPINNHKLLRTHFTPNHLKPLPRKRFVGVNQRISISVTTLPSQIYISLHFPEAHFSFAFCLLPFAF